MYHNTQLKIILQSNSRKTVWYWHKNRHEDQWNRIQDLDMDPHNYTQLIFDKGIENIWWRKDSLFNKSCWEKWLAVCKNLKLESCLSKWIKDLNIRTQTLKLVQERVGNTLDVIGIGKDFLNRTPAAQQLRERMDKWNFIKLKCFCSIKEMVFKLKRAPRVGGNICQLYIRQRTDNQNIQGTQNIKLP
jgi:hypothetical protein